MLVYDGSQVQFLRWSSCVRGPCVFGLVDIGDQAIKGVVFGFVDMHLRGIRTESDLSLP